MATFPGFAVSGYRSLFGDQQWIPLDAESTVLLGGNNSGKSNVLRLLDRHLAAIFESLSGNSALHGFDVQVDAPIPGGDGGLQIHWPLDVEGLRESEHVKALVGRIDNVLQLDELNRFETPSLPFSSSALDGQLLIDVGDMQGRYPHMNWRSLSGDLTGASGGGGGEDAQRVLTYLKRFAITPPLTYLIPPSRAVTAGQASSAADSASWDFSGAGLIDRLAHMQAPAFHEQELRERADALTRDLRVLLEDYDLEWQVTHDRTALTIRFGGQWLPLSSLGTGTEHAVIILAARHVYLERLLLLEEPDAHLHPRLQRRLVAILRDSASRPIAIATHSAHMIDAAETVVSAQLEAGRTRLERVGDRSLFAALRSLGYRASDLLQANCVIWVEGPSDRIYILHWLRALAPDLVEGVDFAIAFYGGALLARLSAAAEEERDDPTLVDLWRINRRMWVVMDSDQGEGELKPAVKRLRDEIDAAATGGTWITSGYTIENYLEHALLQEAIRAVHASIGHLDEFAKSEDPLGGAVRADGQRIARLDKVAIALAVCTHQANLDIMDLRNRIAEVVGFIRDTPNDLVSPDITGVAEIPAT